MMALMKTEAHSAATVAATKHSTTSQRSAPVEPGFASQGRTWPRRGRRKKAQPRACGGGHRRPRRRTGDWRCQPGCRQRRRRIPRFPGRARHSRRPHWRSRVRTETSGPMCKTVAPPSRTGPSPARRALMLRLRGHSLQRRLCHSCVWSLVWSLVSSLWRSPVDGATMKAKSWPPNFTLELPSGRPALCTNQRH